MGTTVPLSQQLATNIRFLYIGYFDAYVEFLHLKFESKTLLNRRYGGNEIMKTRMKYIRHINDVEAIRNSDLPGAAPRDSGTFKDLISERTGTLELGLGIGWLQPGEMHISHHHPDIAEFYYVLEGSAEITVEGEAVQAVPGTFCYIPVNAKHKITNNTAATFCVLFGLSRGSMPTTIWDE